MVAGYGKSILDWLHLRSVNEIVMEGHAMKQVFACLMLVLAFTFVVGCGKRAVDAPNSAAVPTAEPKQEPAPKKAPEIPPYDPVPNNSSSTRR